MSVQRPEPGTRVSFAWRKWDGSPHWVHDCIYLGSDAWGDWVGQPAGWRSARPGRDILTACPHVSLVPVEGDFALTVLRDHPRRMRVYIDLAWEVRWSEDPEVALGIDMDLDVVRWTDARGTVLVDQDEWAEHSVRFGYPAEVMAHLERRAEELEHRVRAQEAPFDDTTADAWLDRLAAWHP